MNLDSVPPYTKADFIKHYNRWGDLTHFLEKIEEAILGEEPETRFRLEELKLNTLDELAAEYNYCKNLAEMIPDINPKILAQFK